MRHKNTKLSSVLSRIARFLKSEWLNDAFLFCKPACRQQCCWYNFAWFNWNDFIIYQLCVLVHGKFILLRLKFSWMLFTLKWWVFKNLMSACWELSEENIHFHVSSCVTPLWYQGNVISFQRLRQIWPKFVCIRKWKSITLWNRESLHTINLQS